MEDLKDLQDTQVEVQRDNKGRFMPGHKGMKRKGSRKRITQRMLTKYEDLMERENSLSPIEFWNSVVSGHFDNTINVSDKDLMNFKLIAARDLVKAVADPSYDTEAVEKLAFSPEQLEALQSVVSVFDKPKAE